MRVLPSLPATTEEFLGRSGIQSGRRISTSILVVEDDDAHAALIQRGLQEQPSVGRIDHVRDGEEALDFLFRRGSYATSASPRPALVLLDVRLPKVDGLEVLRQIKSSDELKMIPVVMLSTSEAEADIRAASVLRANSYLVQPLDPKRFTDTFTALAAYWFGYNQPPLRPS